MVEFGARQTLPDQFVLLFKHKAEPCRVVWQQGELAGVQFVELP